MDDSVIDRSRLDLPQRVIAALGRRRTVIALRPVYRRVYKDPVGRWLLCVVWAGLGMMTAGVLAYVPLLMAEQGLLDALTEAK